MKFTLKVNILNQKRPRTIWRKLGTFSSIAQAKARAERHLATVYSRNQIEHSPSIRWTADCALRRGGAVYGCAYPVYIRTPHSYQIKET